MMKYTLILISSIWLQTSVQADWWNPNNMDNINPMGFMNKMPFSNMEPLTMFPDPQIPQLQFTPPNMADAKNMGNILRNIGQDMPSTVNTLPNNMYNMGNMVHDVNPWNQQQNYRNVYPKHIPQQNVWQQPQARQQMDLRRYGRPNGRGSYYGANWNPFTQTRAQTSSKPKPHSQTNIYNTQPAYTPSHSSVPVLNNSRAPTTIGYKHSEIKRPMPTQFPAQSYQDLFD